MDRPSGAPLSFSTQEKQGGADTSGLPAGTGPSQPGTRCPANLDLMPLPFFLVDAQAQPLLCNRAARCVSSALELTAPTELLPLDWAQRACRSLQTGQAEQATTSFAGTRFFSWCFVPDRTQGRVQIHGVEVTDRQRLQERLKQVQPLEMVGRLAGSVAHDLANNLTVIGGHLGMMQEGVLRGAAIEESLRQSLRATERASDLVKQLFALRGSERARLGPVAAMEVLGAFSGRLQRLLGEDVELTFQIEPDLPPVLSEEGRLQQLVTAAALEVRSAIPGGGSVIIGLTMAETQEGGSETVCLSVLGAGVPSGKQEPVSSQLVESLAGPLDVSVAPMPWPEHGLHLYLPVTRVEEGEQTSFFRAQSEGTETVMVVEDEAPVRSIIRMALERRGYTVVDAASGVEALAVWHQHHDVVALLVTDMVMPVGLSGRELAEKFRVQNPDLKVLYVSGYTAEAAGLPVSLTPGEGYLRKPLDPDELTHAVRSMIDG